MKVIITFHSLFTCSYSRLPSAPFAGCLPCLYKAVHGVALLPRLDMDGLVLNYSPDMLLIHVNWIITSLTHVVAFLAEAYQTLEAPCWWRWFYRSFNYFARTIQLSPTPIEFIGSFEVLADFQSQSFNCSVHCPGCYLRFSSPKRSPGKLLLVEE